MKAQIHLPLWQIMKNESSSLKQWEEWNKQGFIPGPEESEEAFKERIVFCQNLRPFLKKNIGKDLPFEEGDPKSQEILQRVLPITQKLYGIEPLWVPIFFSNYKLSPWHGGCAWIFQFDETTPTAAFLQLRASFRDYSTYLKIYQREELIAHEIAHVGRMVYQEPAFEEIFAYQSSSSRWRKWMGPIVQSSKETLFFILLLGLVLLADLALLSLDSTMQAISFWLKGVPIACFGLALGRLMYRYHILKRCSEHLRDVIPSESIHHFLYRLQDSEIKDFSRLSSEKILEFIEHTSSQSFRWRFLRDLYVSKARLKK